MPEALATTKRKFYKALDALTTASNKSLASTASVDVSNSDSKLASSAAAFDEARERARKRLRASTSTTSLATLNANGSSVSLARPHKLPAAVRPSAPKSEKPPPNFSPWSQERFLARLQTFASVTRWHPKPDAINEVAWARRGWACVDVNTVACRGGCERRRLVSVDVPAPSTGTSLNDDDDEGGDEAAQTSLEQALVQKYAAMIVEGHAETCLWRKAGCKDDIYRLQVIRPSVWQPELRRRFLSLLAIADAISEIPCTTADHQNPQILPSERLLADLPADIIRPDEKLNPASLQALRIALHGWRGSLDSGTQLLHCDACFQRVGLWMYQPAYLAARSSSLSSATPAASPADAAADADDEDVTLHLLHLHREHCPWRNPTSQAAAGSLAGQNAAAILAYVASTCARDHRRRSAHAHPIPSASGDREAESGQEREAERGQEREAGSGGERDAESGEEDIAQRPVRSREEIARLDREREGRLRKLRNLFNFKGSVSRRKVGTVAK